MDILDWLGTHVKNTKQVAWHHNKPLDPMAVVLAAATRI